MLFAEKLATAMAQRSMTASQVALPLDVSLSTVKNWLKGKHTPEKLSTILNLSQLLGVNPSDLIERK